MITITGYKNTAEALEEGFTIIKYTLNGLSGLRPLSDITITTTNGDDVTQTLYDNHILYASTGGNSTLARIFGQERVIPAASSLHLTINNEYILD